MRNQDLFEALGERVSDHTGSPAVVLDRSFCIRAVNAEYENAVLRPRAELIGGNLFELFPDNPDDPHANGNDKLAAIFETVLRTKSAVSVVQRYDIPDVDNEGQFIPKVWIPKHMPVTDGADVMGIVSHVAEVTDVSQAVCELAREIEEGPETGDPMSPVELLHTLAAFTAALPLDRAQRKALADENSQLKRALETRDVIGQAKGILMERFNTDGQQAFRMLVRLSQDSHMRVADVSRRLIEVEHPSQP
jgi:ANTAR domain/PAS fold